MHTGIEIHRHVHGSADCSDFYPATNRQVGIAPRARAICVHSCRQGAQSGK